MLNDAQREQLETWVLTVLPRAVAYARSLLRDRSQAEDVVQECLYRLLRRADTYDLPRDGVRLLFKAVSNLCINRSTRDRALYSLDAPVNNGDSLPLEDRVTAPPEQFVLQRELQEEVAKALQRLPELQRAALELRALGQSKVEIGEILGVSASNAGVLVHRARQALADELGSLLPDGFAPRTPKKV